jgi:hypothetical protein
VKVGDLVRYRTEVRGMSGLMGVIIANNGEGFDIHWIQDRTLPGLQRTTDLPWFLEKVENET